MSSRRSVVLALLLLGGCAQTLSDSSGGGTSVQPTAEIVVSSKDPDVIGREISGMNRVETLRALARLNENSLDARNRNQSVIYIINGNVESGDVVTTTFTYTRAPGQSGSPRFDDTVTYPRQHAVTANSPRDPLIIIESWYSEYRASLGFEAEIDGRSLGTRSASVVNDFQGG